MLHSKLGSKQARQATGKLSKVACGRIAGAAVFNSGTALAGLGYTGVQVVQTVLGSAETDSSVLSIVVLTIVGIVAGLTALAGLHGMASAGTEQLREEELIADS